MFENDWKQVIIEELNKEIGDCTNEEIYYSLLLAVKNRIGQRPANTGERKLYYISAEFLIGKLLSNNLINLGLYDEVAQILNKHGKSISEIEEIEPEPSLGNGGLGRLAACFLDSIATLGLQGDGIGINYHLGLFKQMFQENKQKELPNPWIEQKGWLTKTDLQFDVPFKDFTLTSKLYDIDVTGYENGTNKLHLFDIDSVQEDIVKEGIDFDKKNIAENLTLFLYPDDSDRDGELLRIYQQYFMVSSGAQLILKQLEDRGHSIAELDKYVAIQINDTHPSLVIPELIRLLTKRGVNLDEAIRIVTKTCAYTNHTILAEALEKWPLSYLEEVVPHLIPIIRELDARVREQYKNSEVAIIDEQGRVHMARMDMHYGHSVNGVAALHTEILKQEELSAFYEIYPEKFNNKTNGITFRRWLLHSNKELVKWMDKYVVGDYRKDATKLESLLAQKDNEEALHELLEVKKISKIELKKFLKQSSGVDVDENSIFDIQIKRLHEYKRQQMNVLYVIHKYLEIKSGIKPSTPITMIFGAKAAPAYTIAKDIIHVILCLQELIQNDSEVAPYLNVVMVENYNVTMAEKLIPACDVSEQISLASKEASGTGNMKFMLNGAVTLGTEDGANVEIHQLVGDENIYIFGESSEQVIEHYKKADYVAADYYINKPHIKKLIDFIISADMMKIGDVNMLLEIHGELIKKDWFMTLLDIEEYIIMKEKVYADYEDRIAWSKKMLVNISKAGFFSADRTIAQYNEEIWKL